MSLTERSAGQPIYVLNVKTALAGFLALMAVVLNYVVPTEGTLLIGSADLGIAALALIAAASADARVRNDTAVRDGGVVVAAHLAGVCLLLAVGKETFAASTSFWALVIATWLMAWAAVERLTARIPTSGVWERVVSLIIPIVFGAWLLILWELIVVGLQVPTVILPPPSMIAERFVSSTDIIWADFQQTFLKAVLIGYAMGCGLGFLVAIIVDRVPFLRRGLLPIGNLVSALPIIGVAPIMVMWFGFDWPSKAAVVVIMTFFPMLVNTVTGLSVAGRMERDLMATYAANYWHTLFKLRLPAALPFIFNALKINSTLALIGAIVAEFFGTPTVGMGFRISTEVGRLNVDMVWAEIAVAAVAGSAFYGIVSLIERYATFWHPSMRKGR